jgi:hypothetical protein
MSQACSGDKMSNESELISARREDVIQGYNSAKATNHRLFLEGDEKATSEYIYPNQIQDANKIVDMFYKDKRRVISITKKTKVGADGLMIEITKLLTTHNDDNFVVNAANVRILTGMSNASWEKAMIDKAPNCFKDKIFHHGKLSKADLKNMQNSLIIIDEIDTGDKEYQVLHTTLKEAEILDVKHMEENNNRFVFISATMIKELYDLYTWGELHAHYKMTIPDSYIGHKDFLDRGVIEEFYDLSSKDNADKWIQEDILNNYGHNDLRVHLVRVNAKTVNVLQNACIRRGIAFRNHTSADRITEDEIKVYFKEPLTQHIVLAVKGFFRRANLIPNRWKLRIGATHELYTKIVDNNVQIQGLPGRMSGYWRDDIEKGHRTGPHRTSIKAIEEYEKIYEDPFGNNSYQTTGLKKDKGKVQKGSTMLSAHNIPNLEAIGLPAVEEEKVDSKLYRIYSDEEVVRQVCKILGYRYKTATENNDGFRETSLNDKKEIASLERAIRRVPDAIKHGGKNSSACRTCYPCYTDITDNTSLRFVVIIRPETDPTKLVECDGKFNSITL